MKSVSVLYGAEQGDCGHVLKATWSRDQVAAGQMSLSPIRWHFGGASLACPQAVLRTGAVQSQALIQAGAGNLGRYIRWGCLSVTMGHLHLW